MAKRKPQLDAAVAVVRVLLMIGLLASEEAAAQTTSTNCSVYQYSYSRTANINCQSTTINPIPSSDPWAALSKSLAEIASRNEQRAVALRQQLLLEQQNRLIEAAVSSRTVADAEAKAEARARAEASARLFWRKADAILSTFADSVGLTGDAFGSMTQESRDILRDSFLANPLASSARIRDDLTPVLSVYARRAIAFERSFNKWLTENRARLNRLSVSEIERIAQQVEVLRPSVLKADNPAAAAGTAVSTLTGTLSSLETNATTCRTLLISANTWLASRKAKAAKGVIPPDPSSCSDESLLPQLRDVLRRALGRVDSIQSVDERRAFSVRNPVLFRKQFLIDSLSAAYSSSRSNWSAGLAGVLSTRVQVVTQDLPSPAVAVLQQYVDGEGRILATIVEKCLQGLACDRMTVDVETYTRYTKARR